MIIHQQLKIDGDKVILRNVTEDDPVAKAARARRSELNLDGNAKGWSAGRTLMHAAMIDPDVYFHDPLCREMQRLKAAGNHEAARRVLRLFLSLNPQYRCSAARL